MKRLLSTILVLLLTGCQSIPLPTDGTETTLTPAPEVNPPDPEDPLQNREAKTLSITASETPEIVFDWTTDRCEDLNIPDIAARAFRGADGTVQMWIGHFVSYRMVGPDLDHLESDCRAPVMDSDFDPDPAMFNDSEWPATPYTEDGTTIYAIVHNEYRGDTHDAARPGQCPSHESLTCLDTSVTMAISTDGGASFHDIQEPPNHMIATMPYTFNDQGVPSGLRQPSNIIKGRDGYFYVYTNISDYPKRAGDFPPQWVCAMRTNDLSDPTSWRYWNGDSFSGRFVNPYLEPQEPNASKCQPLEHDDLSASVQESVTYNTALERYIMVGISFYPNSPDPRWGVYYSLSDDLIHWTQRKLIMEVITTPNVENDATDPFYAYPSLLDPDSQDMNFGTTDQDFYLYLTHLNAGGLSLDRDLVRYPIHIDLPVYPIPTPWRFETDGDPEGWLAENDLTDFYVSGGSLLMQSIGDDPSFHSPSISVPANEFNQLTVTMKVSPGTQTGGQLFFVTDADSEWDEAKSLHFDVNSDGIFHTYELNMSGVAGWQGVITDIRLDPVESTGRTIEIDSIAFVN
jgi:hypothetical protein